jgi:hypothetical protein
LEANDEPTNSLIGAKDNMDIDIQKCDEIALPILKQEDSYKKYPIH